jgi:hypothetical protein
MVEPMCSSFLSMAFDRKEEDDGKKDITHTATPTPDHRKVHASKDLPNHCRRCTHVPSMIVFAFSIQVLF